MRLVEAAARLDESDTECHRIMCRIALFYGRFANSEYHLERVLTQNPNDPRLVVQRGINMTYLGNPVAAIPCIERAMRLDPFSAHHYYLDLVQALFMAERATEAIRVLEPMESGRFEHYALLRPAGQSSVTLRLRKRRGDASCDPPSFCNRYLPRKFVCLEAA